MRDRTTESNLAARALFEAAFSPAVQNRVLKLDELPDTVADALVMWSSQRGVAVHSIEERAAVLEYDGLAVYCFRFGSEEGYNGVVCIDRDGTVLAEDSRVSACP